MDKKFQSCNLPEVWGGIECTINRIGNIYLDQLQLAGHYERKDDIEIITTLGIKALRYPVLWERHQPGLSQTIDWSWASQQLHKLSANDITPIAGLVHHGSGPAFTHLLDPGFPQKLAAYAKQVAIQFPWLEYYTPVNEPLTTARFSGLYGHWYPHKHNDASFIKILLNEVKAVILSMQAIREINPHAKLVQTEDLCKTYSTPLLHYQAKFENERRWLTYDLLCGKVNEQHFLWGYLTRLGISVESLHFFLENPCPPDIIGVNYYVTSERYLDEDTHHYHPSTHGGNGFHSYADAEAVRVRIQEPAGFAVLIKELWERYKLPIAVTEVHLNCSREEQLKWFNEIYDASAHLKRQGVNIIAVTAWSLLGAYGWNKLLTCTECDYESGVYNINAGYLRPTALATLIKQLTITGSYHHPVLQQKGWWRSQSRFYSNEPEEPGEGDELIHSSSFTQPILIIGKNGTLGQAFAKICEHRNLHYILLNRQNADISSYTEIEKAIKKYNPWAVINAAGYVRVDDAETDIENCFTSNTLGPQYLALACKKHNIKLVSFSSDLVFDGAKQQPYYETDKTNPLNIYGKSKAQAERQVLQTLPSALVIRTSAFFGPWDEGNFINNVLHHLNTCQPFAAAADVHISPTYVPHLVHASLDLLIDDEKGIWHLCNDGEITWYQLAAEVALRSGYDAGTIIPQLNHAMQLPAKRPRYSVLKSAKGNLMPSLHHALNCYFNERCIEVAEMSNDIL